MAYPLQPPMSHKQYQKFLSIAGFNTFIQNFQTKILEIEGLTLKGMIRSAKYIQRDMETTPPLTPVKTGRLRSSFQIHTLPQGLGVAQAGISGTNIESPVLVPSKGRGSKGIIFGYSVKYALWVHEMIGAHYTRPGSGAHWFKAAIERNQEVIMQILASETKI